MTNQGKEISIAEELSARGVHVVRYGASDVPEELIKQLVEKSRQQHILQYGAQTDVGDGQNPGRFYDLDSYNKWAKKGRTVYLLMGENSKNQLPDVGGIIWFGERKNVHAPGCSNTFAIRHYDEDADKGWGKYYRYGFGTEFMRATHKDFVTNVAPGVKIWLDVVDKNIKAIELYERLGYKKMGDPVDDKIHTGRKRLVMQYIGIER